MPPALWAVTGEVNVENGVGCRSKCIEEFNTEWQVRWQYEYSTMIFVQL